MGNMQALGYAEGVKEGWVTLETALEAHLGSNHFPPVHPVFVATAVEAIDRANMEDWDHEILMPNGIKKTVGSIVEELHLDAFLDFEED